MKNTDTAVVMVRIAGRNMLLVKSSKRNSFYFGTKGSGVIIEEKRKLIVAQFQKYVQSGSTTDAQRFYEMFASPAVMTAYFSRRKPVLLTLDDTTSKPTSTLYLQLSETNQVPVVDKIVWDFGQPVKLSGHTGAVYAARILGLY